MSVSTMTINGFINRNGQKCTVAGGGTPVDISGKADKVDDAVSGNFAGLDSEGNLTDSGKKASDFAAASHNHDSSYAAKVHNHLAIMSDGGKAYVQCNENVTDGGMIEIYVEDENGDDTSVDIKADNIGNLVRALATPSSTPENNANKLITSKAVYDVLAGKMNKILTLRIDVNTSDDDYPMVTEAGSLLSAFVNNVSVGTYVPVLVELHTQSATLGTILGIAKWTLEGQEDEHDVEIRIGKLLFSTYRQVEGQQLGVFTDWTKSSSQDIKDYFS